MIETRYRRASRVAGRMLDGRYCLMKIAASELIVLNESGSRIWDLLDTPRNLQDLVDSLCAEYHVETETARQQSLEFLSRLTDAGLIVADGE